MDTGSVASGNVDSPTRRVGAKVWPVGLIPTPCGVDTDSREPTVIIGGLSCHRNATGFTLIGLLLPAVQSAREAARRAR